MPEVDATGFQELAFQLGFSFSRKKEPLSFAGGR
jgi:hypothetical protein